MLELAARHARPLDSYYQHQGDSNDCGPHVVAMAINFWRGTEELDGHAVAQIMNRPRVQAAWFPLVIRRVPNWATFPWGIADMLRQHDIPARWRLYATEEHIQRALRENRLIMPMFGEPFRRRDGHYSGWSHVALISGYDEATEEYIFVDSSEYHAPTRRPRAEFLQLWGNLARLLVETK